MISSKTETGKSSTIHTLKIVLPLVAWVAFLFSFVFPFYCTARPLVWHSQELDMLARNYYWSHKYSEPIYAIFSLGDTPVSRIPQFDHDYYYWFDALWFRNKIVVENGMSWVFVSMFVAQSLVLASGLISVYTDRKNLSFIPMALGALVIILMTVVGISFSKVSPFSSFEIGHWLSLLSLSLFTASYILKMKYPSSTSI